MGRLMVVGSLDVDLVTRPVRHPKPGGSGLALVAVAGSPA